ncbi:PDDEXK nuclease domain-containing protein [bacterium]|nr:PDDEXK nuclease domain-containing protein [bacterium]
MIELLLQRNYKNLIQDIGVILDEGRKQAYKTVNNILVKTYWEIGKRIVEFEQHGKITSEYGSKLLINLSKELSSLGKGFSRSNLTYMRLFYIKYPKSETVSHQLSWSHYFELLKIDDDLARSFYEKQCVKEKWSIRELKRQKNSMLFERIALSKSKKEVFEISKKGQIIETAKDIIKEPYVLEFLGIPEDHKYSEKELEQKMIDNLQMFLLELGKGFTFVKRQFRMTLSNRHYYADLVFYHRILKCFVIIDLKIGEVDHGDVGQMNMYLNYFKTEENTNDDNEPIGIILSAEKEHISVQYALGGISNQLFVSRYQLYLPKKEELEVEIKKLLE